MTSLNLTDFLPTGYVTDGSVDYTTNWQAAIDAAAASESSRKLVIPLGTWNISSSLDLKDKDVILEGTGYLDDAPHIVANFDGFIFDVSGTVSGFSTPSVFTGLRIENRNDGTDVGSAGCFDLSYSSLIKIADCEIISQNTGLLMAETISIVLENVVISGDSGTNSNHIYSRGINGGARNFKMYGGRIYGCYIAADIRGDSLGFYGTNLEFNDIPFRTGPLSTLLAASCHLETSGMILTNAEVLPTVSATPWTDNGGEGIGWTGAVTFLNCQVAFNPVGAPNGVAAPAFVIKSQPSFTGCLNLEGNNFAIPDNLATVSQSFDRTASTSAASGLNVIANGNTGLLKPAAIPDDSYTTWAQIGSEGVAFFNRIRCKEVLGDGGKLTGFSKLGLNDPSAYFDLSDGTAVNGYTTASLKSVYYGLGVRLEGAEFKPTMDSTCSLGTSGLRWSDVYAANGTIQTSDRNAKTDFQKARLGLDFIKALRPLRYKMRESGRLTPGEEETFADELGNIRTRIKPASQRPIPGERFHEGLVAQDVKEALDRLGIDSAIWIKDENGRQGLRYEELIAPLIKAVQELSEMMEISM